MYKSRIKRLEERVESLEKVSAQPVKILYSGRSIVENIKTRRQSLGMTQEDLAGAIGIGRSMVAQIERGSKIPNMMLGRDIARVLGCGMEKLLEEA